jgi:hypothetical protein
MAYRNDLVAAQSRGKALEAEVGNLRRQLAEHGSGSENGAWSRLIERGASEENRFRQAASRARVKSAEEAQKAAVAKERGEKRAAMYRRFDERRRYTRSTTRLGWSAHWCFNLIALLPPVCFFWLCFIYPSTWWVLLGYVGAVIGVWGFSNVWATFWATREDARLEALPFHVEGHHELLKSEFTKVVMTLSFEGSAPSASQMRRWMYGLATEIRGPALRSTVRNTRIESSDHSIDAMPKDLGTTWMAGNRSYLVWYRRVVEKALVELHGAFPLSRVTMSEAE